MSAALGLAGAFVWISFLPSAAAQSGLFSEVATSLPADTYFPSASWADFDNDGDLDALLGGSLYRNDRSGAFSLITSNLPVGDRNAVAWGDYDRDGDLDLVIAGKGMSRIYRNDGGNFVNINVALPVLSQMGTSWAQVAAAWGDCDHDGDLDLLLSGYMPTGVRSTILYRNDGNETFTSVGSAGLAGIDEGAIAWGDYDRDGDLDVLLSGGVGPSTFLTEVYRNDGNGAFTPVNAGLRGVRVCSAAWGDYDGDGHLDILSAGFYYGNYVLDVYRNSGDGTFTNINVGLQGIAFGSAKWADFDQDGDLDMVLGGVIVNHGTAWITRLYRNNGNHTFSDAPTVLPDTSGTSLDWGDYDGDGDLDILLTGGRQPTPVTRVYQNNSTPNTPPQAPEGLVATVLPDNEVLFQWNTPTDPQQTNSGGLSYQLRVGSIPGGRDLVSPHANEVTAFRRLPERGLIATNSWRLRNVPKGVHYWSVQAIDAGLAGSAFAAEGIFEVTNARPLIAGLSNVVVIPNQTAGPLAFTVGDMETPPGALLVSATSSNQTLVPNGNIILGGSGSTRTVTIVPAPSQAGTAAVTVVVADAAQLSASNTFLVAVEQFTALSVLNSGYNGAEGASLAWGDFDNDADLDLLLGSRQSPIQLLGNEGMNVFSLVLSLPVQSFGDHALAWSDFDHDGFLDFASQNAWMGPAIYQNNRNRTFSEMPGLEFFRVGSGVSFDWGDYDNDGDSDLLMTGLTHQPPYGALTRVLRNEGAGAGFSVLSVGLTDVGSGGALWADFDNDGWLDVLMAGTTNVVQLRPTTGTNFAGIFRNNRLGGFDLAPVPLPALGLAELAVADFDADGDIDFALGGFLDQATNRFCRVFRNEGGWNFTDTGQILPGLIPSSLSWGDYDNDGRSDLAVTGTASSVPLPFGKITRVFRYDGASGFIQPAGAVPEFWSNAAEWGDFDGDGDLDLTAHGIVFPPARNPVLLRNNQPGSNQPPSTPALLEAIVSGNDARLMWTSAADPETPAAGLAYNLRVGTNPGGTQIVSPQSSSLGHRRIPKSGNAGQSTAKLLRHLRAGTYYWSVQAVDSAFAGSPFAAEGTFSVTNPLPPWFDLISVITIKEDSPRQTNSLTGITSGDAVNNFTLSFSNGSPALLTGVTLAYNPPLTSGQLQFQLVPNAWGTGAVTITASGVTTTGEPLSFARTLNVVVTSVNDGPYAFSLVTNGVEDTPLALTLPARDPDGDALTFTLRNPPRWGTLSGGGTQVIYHPATNYFGFDSFIFTASDGESNSLPGSVQINLAAVPDVTGSRIALQPFTNASYQVTLTGEPYVYYSFQASSNLTTWTELEILRASSNGIATWIDVVPPATTRQRFYRGRTPP